MAMSEPTPPSGAMSSNKDLSAVLGKIVDQLSLSAWMPGLALACGLALLVAVRETPPESGGIDFAGLFDGLAALSLGAALALLAAVVIATVVAQAFEFEMIKLLEGYWGHGGVASKLTARRVAAHVRKLTRLRERRGRLEKEAFKSACARIAPKDPNLTAEVRKLRKADLARRKGRPVEGSGESLPSPEAEHLYKDWRRAAEPSSLRALEACEAGIRSYPSPHRLLPTRLGNVLRSAEDRMKLADKGSLEGFVLRNYDRIPTRLQLQLSDFRTRLNMYCSLELVCLLLAILAVPATWPYVAYFRATTVVAVLLLLALCWLCYKAAVTSARGYVSALLACDDEVSRALSSSSAPVSIRHRGVGDMEPA